MFTAQAGLRCGLIVSRSLGMSLTTVVLVAAFISMFVVGVGVYVGVKIYTMLCRQPA